jgi:tripartite-type tricarboxylate transporter receptor subunit TctC
MNMTHKSARRSFLLGSLVAAALGPLVGARGAIAQTWPSRPIKIIASFPPAGLGDLFTRAYGEHLSKVLGQPVVIENRPGASGLIGADAVAKAPPDGYTFLVSNAVTLVQNQALYKKLPFDPNKDLSFIARLSAGHMPLAVHKDLPVRNFREFLDFSKKNQVNFGTFSAGTYAHMLASQINKLFGLQIEAIHFKGEGPMWQELAAGRLHAAAGTIVGMAPHLQSGAVRPIAVNATSRSPLLPQVLSFVEQGFAQGVFLYDGWLGLTGPAGLARSIVERISALILEGDETPRLRQLHATWGIVEEPMGHEQFERYFREECPKVIAMVKELGVSLD